MDAVREKIVSHMPAIVDATIAKLSKYHHPDGSFSYHAHASSPYTQGTYVSLGEDEGDVNGTAVGIHYSLNAIWGWFGVPMMQMPLCADTEYDAYRKRIAASAPVKKLPRGGIERLDYAIGSVGSRQKGRGNWHMNIQGKPDGSAGKALRCVSAAGGEAVLSYQCADPFHPIPAVRRTEWEIDLYVGKTSLGDFAHIAMADTDPVAAALILTREGEEVLLRRGDTGEICLRAGAGTWLSLRMMAEAGKITLSVNGMAAPAPIPAPVPDEDSRLTLCIPAEADAEIFINNLWGQQHF